MQSQNYFAKTKIFTHQKKCCSTNKESTSVLSLLRIINLIIDAREIVIVENIYTSGPSDRFNSWLCRQNKRKVDADFQAAREEQNWYSTVTWLQLLPKFSDVNSLVCNFSDWWRMYHIHCQISIWYIIYISLQKS